VCDDDERNGNGEMLGDETPDHLWCVVGRSCAFIQPNNNWKPVRLGLGSRQSCGKELLVKERVFEE